MENILADIVNELCAARIVCTDSIAEIMVNTQQKFTSDSINTIVKMEAVMDANKEND